MKFCSLAAFQEETLLTDIYVVIQVIASLLLVVLILLHSGKGGGLSDMFGAGGQASSGSTVAEKNLDRITITVALIFTFTTVTLALRMS
ncbi:MAG: preprotein translocase subunit SecG [Actinobacteria bacterium]|nr:preprotein translocase subunit SecG [Actinomycetota bacterium]MCL5446774.1 preprotein translocase subunit SecG [Actinomycetota bacterium]